MAWAPAEGRPGIWCIRHSPAPAPACANAPATPAAAAAAAAAPAAPAGCAQPWCRQALAGTWTAATSCCAAASEGSEHPPSRGWLPPPVAAAHMAGMQGCRELRTWLFGSAGSHAAGNDPHRGLHTWQATPHSGMLNLQGAPTCWKQPCNGVLPSCRPWPRSTLAAAHLQRSPHPLLPLAHRPILQLAIADVLCRLLSILRSAAALLPLLPLLRPHPLLLLPPLWQRLPPWPHGLRLQRGWSLQWSCRRLHP